MSLNKDSSSMELLYAKSNQSVANVGSLSVSKVGILLSAFKVGLLCLKRSKNELSSVLYPALWSELCYWLCFELALLTLPLMLLKHLHSTTIPKKICALYLGELALLFVTIYTLKCI